MPTMTDVLNVIKAGGIVTSGLWAAWTFQKLQQVRKAEVDIRKAEVDIRETEARLLGQQPQLGIDLTVVESPKLSEKTERYLHITVALANEGAQNLEVNFDSPPLTVGRIVFGEPPEQKVAKVLHFPHFYLNPESEEAESTEYRIFRVGQKRQFDFVVLISEPGAYFVQFAAWYYRIAFDEEAPKHREKKSEPIEEKSEPILAYQQRIFLAS